ncbi:hypothetical protein B296_00032065 [Ensete ventricosum]|uniref:Uncharacterized protein n=1 Tax=Ensete ventricosum TaxID=4639 RepID=A0A426ZSU7_ENSVE|nr:hypothetical protein B296_00032065 [Ensete ventricosum]
MSVEQALLIQAQCASSPAVFSVRSWSLARWMMIQSSAREVGCWNDGARVGRKYSSSGRSLIPARRSGRVGSRRDPSDSQWVFVDHPYLATRLPLWLTLSLYASTMPVVLAVRDASTGEGIGLTCVKSVVRLLGYRPYMCQVDCTTVGDSALPMSGRPHDH